MLRRLLALFLSRSGNALTVDLITDQLWHGTPPRTARKAVQVYVHQLRRWLGDDNRIVHDHGTYRFAVHPTELDSQLFTDWAEEARALRGSGELETAVRLWTGSLSLWQGSIAYANIDDVALVTAERHRLHEHRSTVREERLAAELDLGRYDATIGDLTNIATEHPYRERMHGLIMIALYRIGRQAEALATYRDLRERLATELGIDPTPVLQRLHQQILNHDPVLVGSTAGQT